jgi:hypothetical protein
MRRIHPPESQKIPVWTRNPINTERLLTVGNAALPHRFGKLLRAAKPGNFYLMVRFVNFCPLILIMARLGPCPVTVRDGREEDRVQPEVRGDSDHEPGSTLRLIQCVTNAKGGLSCHECGQAGVWYGGVGGGRGRTGVS